MREGLIRGKIANEHHCDPATYVWVLAGLDGIREMNALAEPPLIKCKTDNNSTHHYLFSVCVYFCKNIPIVCLLKANPLLNNYRHEARRNSCRASYIFTMTYRKPCGKDAVSTATVIGGIKGMFPHLRKS